MKLKGNEKGFTLIEMLVVIAILGAIMGVMSMTVIMIMKVSAQSNDWAIALRQVQNAGYWISRDVLMAQTIDEAPTAPEFLILEWVARNDEGTEETHTVTYQLQDMSGGLKKLIREREVDDVSQGQILIAEYVYYDPGQENSTVIAYDGDNRTLTATITATSGEAMVSRQYEAAQRVPE